MNAITRQLSTVLSDRYRGTPTSDVWILDRQQGTLDRFTVGGGWQATWTPDGRRTAFATDAGIYVKRADGTGSTATVVKGTSLHPGSWLPDGRALVFQANGRADTRSDLGLATVGDSVPRWLVATEFRERQPQAPPDGRWLAYGSDRTGQFEISVQPLVGEGPRVQVSTEGGDSPRWSPDSRTLYYEAGGSIVAAARIPGADFQVSSRKAVAEVTAIDLNGSNVNWDIHPDGKQSSISIRAAAGMRNSSGSSIGPSWFGRWRQDDESAERRVRSESAECRVRSDTRREDTDR